MYSAVLSKFEEEFLLPDVPLKRNRVCRRKGTQHNAAAKTENGGEEKENTFPSEASSSKVALSQSNGMYVHLRNHSDQRPHNFLWD